MSTQPKLRLCCVSDDALMREAAEAVCEHPRDTIHFSLHEALGVSAQSTISGIVDAAIGADAVLVA